MIIEENGHSNEINMILKMDIESYEWDVFQNLPIKNLRQFKYIVGEFHFSNSNKVKYINILKKLLATHQIFHVHCNNCGVIIKFDGYYICKLMEISFIQKEGYNFTEDNNSIVTGFIDGTIFAHRIGTGIEDDIKFKLLPNYIKQIYAFITITF